MGLADRKYMKGASRRTAKVRRLGGRLPKAKFGHGAEHVMPDGRVLIDSYHCSRYNQNTGKLTRPMFEAVFERALILGGAAVGGADAVR